jgi:hypothetical protein
MESAQLGNIEKSAEVAMIRRKVNEDTVAPRKSKHAVAHPGPRHNLLIIIDMQNIRPEWLGVLSGLFS